MDRDHATEPTSHNNREEDATDRLSVASSSLSQGHEVAQTTEEIDADLDPELLLLARSQSWRGPLPPPQSIRQYGEIDSRYAEAILDVFKNQSTTEEKDAAAIRRDMERRTDLRFEELALRREESRDDIRIRQRNRPVLIAIAAIWLVAFLAVLFTPSLEPVTRAWVLITLIALAASPVVIVVTQGRVGSENRKVVEATSRPLRTPETTTDRATELPSADSSSS